jgi:hypothetical protein
MIKRLRDRIDARTLARAARVFDRRGWKDAPGYPPVVADARAHLGYRARVLRQVKPAPGCVKAAAKRVAAT